MLRKSLYLPVIFLLLLCFNYNLEAGFINNGTMKCGNLNLQIGGVLENNGELIGTNSANITCGTFAGKGLLSSPQISLKCDVFNFTGTIECENHCQIVASQPFNEKMFKRKGKGTFEIVIAPGMSRKEMELLDEGCNEDECFHYIVD